MSVIVFIVILAYGKVRDFARFYRYHYLSYHQIAVLVPGAGAPRGNNFTRRSLPETSLRYKVKKVVKIFSTPESCSFLRDSL